MKTITCPYCKKDAHLVPGSVVYPHNISMFAKMFYICVPCGAYVGCHKGTCHPLGRLADSKLRELKQDAHKAFDQIWRQGYMTRGGAYKWLSEQLCLPVNKTHIGLFNSDLCKRTIQVASMYMGSLVPSEANTSWIDRLRESHKLNRKS